MSYQELLSLPLEDLTAKYKEVIGEPEEGINKQQMASSIAKALKGDGDKGNDGEKPKETTKIQITPEKHSAKVSDSKTIQLVKIENGKQVDQMSLPLTTWNNLPAGHKKGWQVETPKELKSASDGSNE